MAAITAVITAVAGLGLTAYQMIQSSEDKKSAEKAATRAENQLKSIKEVNSYKALQAPDISKIAFEQNAQSQATTVEALQGMGTEGAAQIARVDEIARANALETAQAQAGINYQRDAAVAQAESGIEQRRVQREGAMALGTLQGAQSATAQAQQNMQAGAVDLIGGIGNLATGIGSATSLEAGAQRKAGQTTPATTQGSPTTSTMNQVYAGAVNDPYADWDAFSSPLMINQ